MTLQKIALISTALAATACTTNTTPPADDSMWLIVGSYSSADAPGIKTYLFDPNTAEATLVDSLSGISNPSYVAINADATMIYSVGEDAGLTSTANAISFDPGTGAMKLVDTVSTGGGAPCHISISPDGRWVLTANYMGANISVIPIDSTGCFKTAATTYDFEGHGIHPDRQEQPHLHFVTFTPDGRRLLADDLGLDQIHVFYVNPSADTGDAQSLLQRSHDIDILPGSGPRHLVFDNCGENAYLINEIGGTVTVLAVNDSTLTPRQYAVADSVGAQGSGDIHISHDGRYLYASNRLQADGIAIFSVDPQTGLLTHVGYQNTGRHPRNFIITPDDRFVLVACRDEDAIEVYSRNAESGLLTDTGHRIRTPKPVCLKFAAKG